MQASTSTVAQVAGALQAVWSHILRTSSDDFLRETADLDLSFTQFKAIMCVGGAGPLSVKAVAEQLNLSEPAASRALEGLVRRGLVERRESEEDRRQRLLSLTPQGVDLRERAMNARMAGLVGFVESLEPSEQEALAAALEPIVRRISA